ncbi:hypothetical protein IV203_022180 [Nitzschia inconspicua]|uniref:Uncharacterized protein n=1 Tax=Nitzschia inconspicua TaxID=303405 RepID=A0A9K3PDY6_9STRA|nr:hypothetical protein IV203_022180 [Nitzschia inconspicua]
MIQSRSFVLVCLFWLSMIVLAQDEATCDVNDGTCQAAPTTTTSASITPTSTSTTTRIRPKHKTRSMRFFSQTSYCTSSTSDLYRNGGSAQAYRPNAAMSTTVCSKNMSDYLPYKVSSWPFSRRSSRKGTAPTIDVTLHLWSCQPKLDDEQKVSGCSCTPLTDVNAKTALGTSTAATVEVWQTQPDGRYTSLHSDGNECRATVPANDQGDVEFSTVAPGSTGIMAGLGPRGWENSPYGPPVMHLLVKAPHHDPLLLDVPVLIHPKTLQERPFSLSIFDWRGLSWSKRSKGEAPPYKVASWTADKEKNHIDMKVNVFLELQTAERSPKAPEFCPSWYFLPGSFFLEPISVCAKYLLDFFQL